MLIYPAIDLIDGKCVRLAQGSFDAVTHYDDKPADRLAAFVRDGARQVHIVDLDGARSGAPVQHQLIGNLATSAGVIVQAAGGVRTEAHVASLLDSGVSRVVIGSLAVLDKDRVLQWLEKYGGEKFTISLDVKIQDDEPIIATMVGKNLPGKSSGILCPCTLQQACSIYWLRMWRVMACCPDLIWNS